MPPWLTKLVVLRPVDSATQPGGESNEGLGGGGQGMVGRPDRETSKESPYARGPAGECLGEPGPTIVRESIVVSPAWPPWTAFFLYARLILWCWHCGLGEWKLEAWGLSCPSSAP